MNNSTETNPDLIKKIEYLEEQVKYLTANSIILTHVLKITNNIDITQSDINYFNNASEYIKNLEDNKFLNDFK
jgi:hypothetical protein